jgi:hypothetical protein
MAETNNTQQTYTLKKRALEDAFKSFHQLILSKVLDSNKSTATKNTETDIINKLVNSVVDLEKVNVGEGVLSLAVIAVREQLTMRDRINDLEYELYKTKREVNKIKDELGIKDDKPKK